MASLMASRELPSGDCWNQIGVQGDGSCPELAEQVHCRNCPRYAAAAQALLDRELPEGYSEHWARHFAEAAVEAAIERDALLIFRIGAEWLALPATVIDEVAGVRPVHALPHRQSGVVLGVVNVRGELVVCVSLGRVLGAAQRPPESGSAPRATGRLLVLRRGSSRFAAPVDEVHGMRRVARSELLRTPSTVGKANGIFTLHVLPWADHAVGCLDDELLFHALERNLT
jgi:chemotaxis-related protein WspD